MKLIYLVLCSCLLFSCETKKRDTVGNPLTHFELSNGEETATYLETINFYIHLSKEFPTVNIQTIGNTDSGLPLHMVTFNGDADFNFKKLGEKKAIILINNGIHPGECDGIDATMLLYRDLATGKLKAPVNTVLVTIPIYNTGGTLNRNSTTRVNQNGPKSYGFRGNSQNYDLNRDFIKSDTREAETFAQIFHMVDPDIFIDNHVSNGADYQYTLTHLFTQYNKLGGGLGAFLNNTMMPELEDSLAATGWDITPYINVFNKVPEAGFTQFMDLPRYSTGYTTLWNTLGLMVETHMLKPYKQRVEGTYALMTEILYIAEAHHATILELREQALTQHMTWQYYPVNWAVDSTRITQLEFKGYEADTLISEVTGFPRLKYDRSRPYTKPVNYFNYFIPADSILIPEAYVVKKGWHRVMELMKLNNIHFSVMDADTTVIAESYRIEDYQTRTTAYEGHYLHYNTRVSGQSGKIQVAEGDIIIPTDQPGIRYILETLEPTAQDSFFNWNFFDTVLQQKEGFSPYIFEDIAAGILEADSLLRKEFQERKQTDPVFAGDWYSQLQWIYQHSTYYDPAHMQYPVYRILKPGHKAEGDTVTQVRTGF